MQDIMVFQNTFEIYFYNRIVCLTREGNIGIGPTIMQPGDEVAMLYRVAAQTIMRILKMVIRCIEI
jgi:hypothetical protein